MSISYSGTFKRSGGIFAAVSKQIRMLNFKGVKRVTVQFDPFDEKANVARDYLFYISSAKINDTNPNCVIKTDIVCNRQKPSVSFLLSPAVQEAHKIKTLKIEVDNLSVLELLKITNDHITSIAPKEEKVSTLKTKSEKKGAASGKRK